MVLPWHDSSERSTVLRSSRMLPGNRNAPAPPAPPGEGRDLLVGLGGQFMQEGLGQQRDILAPVAQRRHDNAVDIEAIQQVLAELASRTSAFRSRLVAAMKRTSTARTWFDPTGEYSRSCSTRSSFACKPASRSPISSRNSVPPCACSTRPTRFWVAPVNAPLT